MKITPNNADALPVDIIVFSRERQNRITQSLKLWSAQPFRYIILDNSENPLKVEFAKNINYFHLPGQNYGNRANKAIHYLSNPYSIICSDDECLIPLSIRSMIAFLERNDNFTSVSGKVVAAYKYGPRLTGGLAYRYMDGYVNRSQDVNVRLKKHLTTNFEGHKPIGGMYRLYRQEGMVKLLESFYFARNIRTPYIYEILGEIISTSQGPTTSLDNVYWIRNWYDGMSHHPDWNRNKTFSSWWTNALNQKEKNELINWICKTYKVDFSLLSKLLDELVKKLSPFDNKVEHFNFKKTKNIVLSHNLNLLKFLVKVLIDPGKVPKSLDAVLAEELVSASPEEVYQIINCAKVMIV